MTTVALSRVRSMRRSIDVNPISEHQLFLRLFVSNSGGW